MKITIHIPDDILLRAIADRRDELAFSVEPPMMSQPGELSPEVVELRKRKHKIKIPAPYLKKEDNE